METGIQSSFIPRDAGDVKASAPRMSGTGFSDLMLLISIVLFVASGALAGGVFVYKQYLETATKSKIEQLQRAKAAFEPALIQQLTRLDDRMHAGASVLNGHISPSQFFAALSQSTLASVAFTSLNFDDSDPTHIKIRMAGIAQSVNAIALQAQLFSRNNVISNPIFSNIGRQADGVHFSLSALVNPAAINYEQTFIENSPPPVAPQVQETTQEPASPFGGAGAQQ